MLEDLRALVEFAHAGSSPVQPTVYSGRPLRLPGKCKGWRLHSVPSCSTAR
jgi:hypothetical protein